MALVLYFDAVLWWYRNGWTKHLRLFKINLR